MERTRPALRLLALACPGLDRPRSGPGSEPRRRRATAHRAAPGLAGGAAPGRVAADSGAVRRLPRSPPPSSGSWAGGREASAPADAAPGRRRRPPTPAPPARSVPAAPPVAAGRPPAAPPRPRLDDRPRPDPRPEPPGHRPEAEAAPTGPTDLRFPINLATALRLSDARPLIVAAAQASVWVAEAELTRAKVLWVPTLNFGADYIRHDGGGPDFNKGIMTAPSVNFFYAGAGLYQYVNLTDAIFEPLVARQVLNARHWDVQSAKNDALIQTADAYFRVHQVPRHLRRRPLLPSSGAATSSTGSPAEPGAGPRGRGGPGPEHAGRPGAAAPPRPARSGGSAAPT